MTGLMYFGNRQRMTWIKCPDSGMGRGGSRYTSEGIFLNGGAFVRNSATGHQAYDMAWNFLRADEMDDIRAYLDGVYGSGLLYFLDPFAVRRNILPTAWASPGVAVDGGPRLVTATETPDPTAVAVPGSYTMGAHYNLVSGAAVARLWLPVPEGHTLHMRATFVATGTAGITLTGDTSGTVSLTSGATASLPGGQGYTLNLTGAGVIDVGDMMAQVWPDGQGPEFSRYYPGTGNSGCRLSGEVSETGYSAPQALDFSALSFTLRETGSWE